MRFWGTQPLTPVLCVCLGGMYLPSLSPLCPHAPGAHGRQLAAGPRRQDRRPRAERGLCGPRLVALLHRRAGTQAAFVGPPPSGARCQVGVREPQGPKVTQCPERCERGSGQDPQLPQSGSLVATWGHPGPVPRSVLCVPLPAGLDCLTAGVSCQWECPLLASAFLNPLNPPP